MKRLIYTLLSLLFIIPQTSEAQSFKEKLNIELPNSYQNQSTFSTPIKATTTKKLAVNGIIENSFTKKLDENWHYKQFSQNDSDNFSYLMSNFDGKDWTAATLPSKINFGTDCSKVVYFNSAYISKDWDFREMFIEIPQIDAEYNLYVNGAKAGANLDLKNVATFDITEQAIEGYNSIIIVAKNQTNSSLLNDNSKFNPIFNGDIYLYSTPKLRIEDFKINTQFTNNTIGNLQLDIDIKTHLLNPKDAKVRYELYSNDAKLITKEEKFTKLELKDKYTTSFSTTIEDVEKYSFTNPYLYYAVITLIHENRVTQTIKIDIPFEVVAQNNGQFNMNNLSTKLYGVIWENENLVMEDEKFLEKTISSLNSLKNRGFNAVLLNEPQREMFYKACDIAGIYVIDRGSVDITSSGTRRDIGGSLANTPSTTKQITQRFINQYNKTKNSPSTIAIIGTKSGSNGYSLYESYLALKEQNNSTIFASNGSDLEWNNDFIVVSNPTDKQIKSFDKNRATLVISNESNIKSLKKDLLNERFAALFIPKSVALSYPLQSDIEFKNDGQNFGTYKATIVNPLVRNELLNFSYKVESEDSVVLSENITNHTISNNSATFKLNNEDINNKILKSPNHLKGKKYIIRVFAKSGERVFEEINFEYKPKQIK